MHIRYHFKHGAYIGQKETEAYFINGSLWQAHSIAFFCPSCCELWYRGIVEGSQGIVYTRHCDRHPHEHEAGNVWLSWNEEWNRTLPREVLIEIFLKETA